MPAVVQATPVQTIDVLAFAAPRAWAQADKLPSLSMSFSDGPQVADRTRLATT
jgi:hypothetical protein